MEGCLGLLMVYQKVALRGVPKDWMMGKRREASRLGTWHCRGKTREDPRECAKVGRMGFWTENCIGLQKACYLELLRVRDTALVMDSTGSVTRQTRDCDGTNEV